MYSITWLDSTKYDVPCSKVVCVGRNYAEHAHELNNPVPTSPILFIKPESSIQDQASLKIPRNGIHYECELAILIGKMSGDGVQPSIAGLGLALDLTDRELQSKLKEKGHPWERAKSFDGATFLSRFVPYDGEDLRQIRFTLDLNGITVQNGVTSDMLFDVKSLLEEISSIFTLREGDVVLTGTPKGVGVLTDGDELVLGLEYASFKHRFETLKVVARGL